MQTQLAEMDKIVEAQIKNLPPATQAQVRKQMEAYKDIAKLPPDKQMEAAMALQEKLVADMSGALEADDPSTAAGTAPATGPLAAGAWFPATGANAPGAPYAVDKLDTDRYIAWALDQAKTKIPDAQLTWISIDGVYPDGHADLSLVDGYVDLRFLSPSRAGQKDKNIPRGVDQKGRACEFRIIAGTSFGAPRFMDMSDFGKCKTATVAKPRCSLKQVWKKALAKKPDLKDAVASVIYTSNIASHKVVWMFRVEDDGETLLSEQFPDDC